MLSVRTTAVGGLQADQRPIRGIVISRKEMPGPALRRGWAVGSRVDLGDRQEQKRDEAFISGCSSGPAWYPTYNRCA